MTCQNCGATVDNDLIFCTNCGERVSSTSSLPQTVVMNESVITKQTQTPTKSGSPLKWIALIVALIAIPISLFIAYILLNKAQNSAQNSNEPANTTPIANATRKPTNNVSNTNAPTNSAFSSNANSNLTSQNANIAANLSNTNSPVFDKPIQIIDERIEIAPGEHIAYPFKTESEARINGDVNVLQGESIEGYVYFQDMYDQHFPDSTYKVFSFEGKEPKVEQKLVNGNYVLVFINKSDKGIMIKTRFNLIPERKNE